MIPDTGNTRAIAVDIRDSGTGTLAGVALLLPSRQHAWVLADLDQHAVERTLPAAVWDAVDAWVDKGDAGLPARPAPLSSVVVAALSGAPSAIANRVASIPVSAPDEEIRAVAERVLREVLRSCRSAA